VKSAGTSPDPAGGLTRRERVMAALGGNSLDRVPLSFWLHNFATENSAEGLAAETIRLARRFDWDYLKPQSRAQCFAEIWGLRYRPSGQRAVPFSVTGAPVADAADLGRLTAADPEGGALGEQLCALTAIRAAVGPDTPIIWTVFAPVMVLPYLLRGGPEQALTLASGEPRTVARALDAIAETLAGYARACLAAGADGLFYATNLATKDLLGAEACRQLHRPYDLRILREVERAPFNVLHVCGTGIHFDEFTDYPATAFSWATLPGNPTLRQGHRRTGRAVVGGLPGKPAFGALSTDAVVGRTRSAIAEMDGRWLLLGPECSVNPDTPDALMQAAGRAARES
jgi:uroporphyrinogen decarboxylase